MIDHSPASFLVARLVRVHGRARALQVLRENFHRLSVVEQAAIGSSWELWARSKQLPPLGNWLSWGFLSGRGFGKTIAASKFVNQEVEEGRAPLVCIIAQDEQSAIDIQVLGPSGLVQSASPKFRPEWFASALQLVWPNGARGYVRTPEVPGKIRGLDYHLTWATEIQSWPTTTREEAFDNVLISTRLGRSRLVWDATSKRRHPLLKRLLARSADDPARHVVVRGTTYENALNLGAGYIEELEREFGKGDGITQRGREELYGEMLSDSESALVKQAWIEKKRDVRPKRFLRKAIGIDPAVTTRAGSDKTGIIVAGLGEGEGQLFVLKDRSGKLEPPTWAAIVLDEYAKEECDLVVVETNKGGNMLAHTLRAAAATIGLVVEVVDDKWQPHRKPGTVFVREIYSRGPKEDRAVPLATAYERGRVSHVRGAELAELEDILTTWEPKPGERSPDGLDALVHVAGELLGFRENRPDARKDFQGITDLSRALHGGETPKETGSTGTSMNLAALLGGGGGGDRI